MTIWIKPASKIFISKAKQFFVPTGRRLAILNFPMGRKTRIKLTTFAWWQEDRNQPHGTVAVHTDTSTFQAVEWAMAFDIVGLLGH